MGSARRNVSLHLYDSNFKQNMGNELRYLIRDDGMHRMNNMKTCTSQFYRKKVDYNQTTIMGCHLYQFPLAPAENPRMFPTAIHEQNIAFAELR